MTDWTGRGIDYEGLDFSRDKAEDMGEKSTGVVGHGSVSRGVSHVRRARDKCPNKCSTWNVRPGSVAIDNLNIRCQPRASKIHLRNLI